MKTLGRQMLSLLLAVVLVLQLIPATVFAEQENTANPAVEAEDIQTDNYSEYTQEELASAQILFEEESLREEDVKHFRLDNGSYIAVQYGTAVHYQDNDGKWVDYDNTLRSIRSMDGSGVSAYRVENGDSIRIFAADANAEALLVVAKDDYSMSLTPVREADAEIPVVPNQPETASLMSIEMEGQVELSPVNILELASSGMEETEDELLSQAQPDKLYSALEYENIFDGADLRYENYGNTIKESIVIASPQAEYVYAFQMGTEGLTPALQEDGSIILTAADGAVIYSIPAPYMIDANNEYSYDAAYTLTGNNGSYILTVTADADWMNAGERAFPVLLDPTVTDGHLTSSELSATFVRSGYPDSVDTSTTAFFVGNNGNSNGMTRSYFRLNKLIDIPAGCELYYAGIFLRQGNHEGSDLEVGLYPMAPPNVAGFSTTDDDQWRSYLSALTWNDVTGSTPEYPQAGSMVDKKILSSSTKNINLGSFTDSEAYFDAYWNVTSLAHNWYAGENYGFALIPTNETSATSRAAFYGLSDANQNATFIVLYRNTVGLEDYYSYQTVGIGRAGTSYISDYTMQNTLVVPLLSSPSNVMPFSLSLIYNSAYGSYQFTSGSEGIHTTSYANLLLGAGWKLSAQETVVALAVDGITYLVHTDADGTEHYFRYSSAAGGYVDEDGMRLIITGSSSSYTMTDEYGNQKTFTNGYLTRVKDAYGNQINYSYSSGRITKITRKNTGSSETETLAIFDYDEDDNSKTLDSITDEAGRVTKFSYTTVKSTTCLSTITFPDNKTAQYTYLSSSSFYKKARLATAYDSEANYGIEYSYSYSKDVRNVYEYIKNGSSTVYGAKMHGYKRSHDQAVYRYYGDDAAPDIDDNGNRVGTDDILTYMIFDAGGRTINSYSTDSTEEKILGVGAAAYTTNSGTSAQNNRLTANISAGQQGVDLLKNGGAERGTGNWTNVSATESTNVYFGAASFPVTNTTIYQTANLTKDVTYTFSGYVKVGSGATAQLAIKSGTTNKATSDLVDFNTSGVNDGWMRLTTTYTPAATGSYRVAVIGTGTIYADALQLEAEDAASTYNLLEDCSFENTTTSALTTTTANTYWTINPGYWYRINSAQTKLDTTYFGSDVLSITGDNSSHHVIQRVAMDCEAGSTFLVSAWAKAAADPDSKEKKATENDTYFGIFVRLRYADDTKEVQFFPFDPYYSGWQFRQGIVAPKKENASKAIADIIVALAYDNNFNTALFDNVSLRKEPAQTYHYDDKGNPISATQAGAGTENAAYTGVNLTQYTAANGNKYTYTYNTRHDILTATAAGIKNTYTYDSSGNAISSKLTSTDTTNTAYLYSSATMSGDRNHTISVTDTAGKTTTYDYNKYNHFLQGTTNANNVTTNYVYYTGNGRMQQTYQSGVAAVSYTYSGGQLSSLDRKTFRNGAKQHQYYNFAYNLWGQNTAIKVGSTNLATYEYEALNSGAAGGGNLTKMTYGNGDSVSYTYDEFDRLIGMLYNDTGDYVGYRYNAEGALARIILENGYGDLIEDITFEYDSLGRLIRSKEIDRYEALAQRTEHIYDSVGRLASQSWVLGNANYSETYSYSDGANGNGSLAKMTTATGDSLNYTYDNLQRLKSVATKNSSGTTRFTTAYAYKSRTDGKTTPLVEYRNVRIGTSGTILEGKKYEYDAVGNIIQISESTGNYYPLVKYEYDDQNQLIKEEYYDGEGNTAANITDTYTYTYDTAGNILTQAKNGTVTKRYKYEDGNWKDLLTEVAGWSITYDSMGNPLGYANGKALYDFEWVNGRRLAFASVDGIDCYVVSFAYDADGIRTQKTVDSVIHNYVTQNGKVVRETIGSGTSAKVLDFIYDESGRPFALKYSTNGGSSFGTYYYVLNLQGDVVGLVNSSGGWVAQYTYNAWGEILTATGTMADINPLRYRGYYYDTETGFYYLRSRYYDPATHRFINADTYTSTGQGIIGTNMFAYCNNCPVMFTDAAGSSGLGLLIGIGVVAVTMLLLTGCASEEEANWPEDCPYEYRAAGKARLDDNCYSYVFDYAGNTDPGRDAGQSLFSYEDGFNGDPKLSVWGVRNGVVADASVRGRKVVDITDYYSPGYTVPDGAYLVVCKLADDRTDYHFAVRLPNGDWVDKEGWKESRYNKIDGFADEWYACGRCYNSDSLYFLYWREQ